MKELFFFHSSNYHIGKQIDIWKVKIEEYPEDALIGFNYSIFISTSSFFDVKKRVHFQCLIVNPPSSERSKKEWVTTITSSLLLVFLLLKVCCVCVLTLQNLFFFMFDTILYVYIEKRRERERERERERRCLWAHKKFLSRHKRKLNL